MLLGLTGIGEFAILDVTMPTIEAAPLVATSAQIGGTHEGADLNGGAYR